MRAFLEAVLERAREGALLLPLWWTDSAGVCRCPKRGHCPHPGKHPLTEKGLDDASSDPAIIAGWWKTWPRANVGERTDGLVRIDIDLVDVAEALSNDVALPAMTQIVRTPRGGMHIAMRCEGPTRSRTLYLDDGRKLGELKADRAYVLIPPSVIGTCRYQAVSPVGVPPMTGDDPVTWLSDLLPLFGYRLGTKERGRRRDYENLAGTIQEGAGRHNALVSYAGRVWVEGMASSTLADLLAVINQRQCQPPLPQDEVQAIAEHFVATRQQRPQGHDPAFAGAPALALERAGSHGYVCTLSMPDGVDPNSFPITDAGNAELFAALYGDCLRYDHKRDRWLVWLGHRWAPDADGEVFRLAKEAARVRYRAAERIEDGQRRERVARFAIASESRQRIEACLALARNELAIADAGTDWDADPWLLGAPNGVVDLRNSERREGRPEDRITMQVAAAYDPAATCPRWDRFLREVFRDDPELIAFIQRAVGYSLTGAVGEQALFFCYGSGSNGKTIFLGTLRRLLGDYAINVAFSVLEIANRTSIPNDLAAIVGRRLVTSSETNEATRLNEARVKALTGGDAITARFLYREPFTFEPVAKFWLAVNHLPRAEDDSLGFWRRVRVIPFAQRFMGNAADHDLADKLRAEFPGILVWAVRGALEWQRVGLAPPPAVVCATEGYRQESDQIAAFLADCCVVTANARVTPGDLYEAYGAWVADEGIPSDQRLSPQALRRRVKDRFESVKSNGRRYYQGIGLRTMDRVAASVPYAKPPPSSLHDRGLVGNASLGVPGDPVGNAAQEGARGQ